MYTFGCFTPADCNNFPGTFNLGKVEVNRQILVKRVSSWT